MKQNQILKSPKYIFQEGRKPKAANGENFSPSMVPLPIALYANGAFIPCAAECVFS